MSRSAVFPVVLALPLLMALLVPAAARGQQGGGSAPAGASVQAETLPLRSLTAGPGDGLEGAVAGDEYRLGPGDILTLSIWGPQPLIQEIPVTLEGKVIIPSVGELDINDQSLSAAREAIRAEVHRQYPRVEVTVTLTGIRRFQIHVLGQVENPGTYIGTAVDRVSSAINWAGGFLEGAARRQVRVMAGDSLRAEADLFSFLQRGIPDGNPYLRDGDIIYVPYADNHVQVRGAVNDAESIEFIEGDTFRDALVMAGQLTSEAYVDTLEIVRYPRNSTDPLRFLLVLGGGIVPAWDQEGPQAPVETGRFPLSLVAARRNDSRTYPNFALRPDDIIFVRSVPDYRVRQLVELQGEVVYPGFYPIREGQTRLSDVVGWAGGLTPDAFLGEARLVRRETINLEDKEFERLKLVPVADMTPEEYQYFKMKARETPGTMVVDFRRALQDRDPDEDVLLYRGDLVVVPPRKDFVSVLGIVSKPGNVTFEPGLTAADYIRRAGDYAADADKGKTRVIKADGGEWIPTRRAGALEPGDVVFIPEKPDRDWWRLFLDFMTVTTQILTIYLIADRAVN